APACTEAAPPRIRRAAARRPRSILARACTTLPDADRNATDRGARELVPRGAADYPGLTPRHDVKGASQPMAEETRKRKWWQWLLTYPTIITTLIGAVPQYTTWAKAYMLNVPWGAVSEAEQQRTLWTKNFECSWKESAQAGKTTMTTGRDEHVTITLCRSG